MLQKLLLVLLLKKLTLLHFECGEGAARSVEMVAEIDNIRVILDLVEDGCLSVHHRLVLEDLFHGHQLRRLKRSSLKQINYWPNSWLTDRSLLAQFRD